MKRIKKVAKQHEDQSSGDNSMKINHLGAKDCVTGS